jgi:hypothetical protein
MRPNSRDEGSARRADSAVKRTLAVAARTAATGVPAARAPTDRVTSSTAVPAKKSPTTRRHRVVSANRSRAEPPDGSAEADSAMSHRPAGSARCEAL